VIKLFATMSPFFFTIPTALLPDDVNVLNGWKISKRRYRTDSDGRGDERDDDQRLQLHSNDNKKNGVVTHIRAANWSVRRFNQPTNTIPSSIWTKTPEQPSDNLEAHENNEYLQYRAKREAMKMMVQADQFDLSGKLIQTFDSCRRNRDR
jgi:hypothetical protein